MWCRFPSAGSKKAGDRRQSVGYTQKNPGVSEINAPVSMTATTLLPWGSDDGQHPSYAFVRLRITITCATNPSSLHPVIHVTGRDSGGVTVRVAAQSMYHGPPQRKLTKEEIAKAWYKNCIKHASPGDCTEEYDKMGFD